MNDEDAQINVEHETEEERLTRELTDAQNALDGQNITCLRSEQRRLSSEIADLMSERGRNAKVILEAENRKRNATQALRRFYSGDDDVHTAVETLAKSLGSLRSEPEPVTEAEALDPETKDAEEAELGASPCGEPRNGHCLYDFASEGAVELPDIHKMAKALQHGPGEDLTIVSQDTQDECVSTIRRVIGSASDVTDEDLEAARRLDRREAVS